MSAKIETKILAYSRRFHQSQITIPPGAFTPRHYHNETHETYIVTGGIGRVIIGNKTHCIKVGSVIEVQSHAPHQVFCDGEDPLIVISTRDRPVDFVDYHEV